MTAPWKMLIGGETVDGASEMPVLNPATEEVYDLCPRAGADHIDAAVAAAASAFPGWSATPIEERRALLLAMADRIDGATERLAETLTCEQGKTLAMARWEVGSMIRLFRYFAGLDLPSHVFAEREGRRVARHGRPLGVVAAITPWNFPLNMVASKLPPALLAGNTIVVKPAATTPLSTLLFADLVRDIVPPGVVNIVTDANDLGDRLSSHSDIRKIAFTGSTQTGRRVMANAASTVKRLTLELGGNDPAILLDDADPAAIAAALYREAFFNCGQTCMAIKRIYVPDALHDGLVEALVALAEAEIVGDGMDPMSTMGPVQNRIQYDKLLAIRDGARIDGHIVTGGDNPHDRGYFLRPTIVTDIADDAPLVREEQFGPILPIVRYRDIDHAIAMANDSPYGLGASIWSPDLARAEQMAARIEAGTVWVNQHDDLQVDIAFGGAKQSGVGTEFGEEGFAEYTQRQIVSTAI